MFTIKHFMCKQVSDLTENPDDIFFMEVHEAISFNIRTGKTDVVLDYVDPDGIGQSCYCVASNTSRLIVENDTGKTIINILVSRGESAQKTFDIQDFNYETVHVDLPDGSAWSYDFEVSKFGQNNPLQET